MNRETVTLTQEEQQRAQVLARIQHNTLRATEAAPLLGLSIRQVRRLLARVRKRGLAALPHGNRGRPSPRRIAEAVRAQVLTLARTRYVGVNDHQLTELLRERDGVRVSRRTVQRLLRAAGIGSPRTRRAPRHRRRRERMLQAGLLVQIDGSHHPWLEDRGPRCVLLAAIDDATGRVVAAVFRDAEDTQGYFLLLRQLVRRYGVPAALYTDRHTIFSPWPRTAAPTLPEQLRGHRDRTQLGRAFHELGIRWIGAHSPQAKGRIERLFGTFQDRLVVELRLAQASTLAEAARVLTRFLPRYNARFARHPVTPAPAWRPAPSLDALEQICCFKYPRTVANDNTVQLGQRLLQIRPGPQGRSYAHCRIEVHAYLNGTVAVYHHGQRLAAHYCPPSAAPIPPHVLRGRAEPPPPAPPQPRRSIVPPPDHPWRRPMLTTTRRALLQRQE